MAPFERFTGVKRGWLALINYLDENSDIHEVREGTHKKDSLSNYFERKRNVGDMHGQAPLLWCARELLRASFRLGRRAERSRCHVHGVFFPDGLVRVV